MIGLGANGFVGISKSTQKEWQEQVRGTTYRLILSLANFVLTIVPSFHVVASQRRRSRLFHHCAPTISREEQGEKSDQHHLYAWRPWIHRQN